MERGAHRVLEELDGDLHRHDLTLADVGPDEVAVLRVWAVLLGAEEVARGEVGEVIFLDEEGALRSFS